MKERYEVDNNIIQEKTEYENEKLLKKLKLIRNEFTTVGKYNMPLIKKQEIDLDKINLWNYTKTKLQDEDNKHKTINFLHKKTTTSCGFFYMAERARFELALHCCTTPLAGAPLRPLEYLSILNFMILVFKKFNLIEN